MTQDQRRFERDPVCGEMVDAQTASHVEYRGRLYYFASTDCRGQFLNDPERYLTRSTIEHATQPAGTED